MSTHKTIFLPLFTKKALPRGLLSVYKTIGAAISNEYGRLRLVSAEIDKQKGPPWVLFEVIKTNGAGNETRTRNPQLGRLVLYQLSYSRSATRI